MKNFRQLLRFSIFWTLVQLFSPNLNAQTWELLLPDFYDAYPLLETETGNLLFMVSKDRQQAVGKGMVKIDVSGNLLAVNKNTPNVATGFGRDFNYIFQKLPDDETAATFFFPGNKADVFHFDGQLNQTQTGSFPATSGGIRNRPMLADGKFLNAGKQDSNLVVEFFDAQNQLIWQKTRFSSTLKGAHFSTQSILVDSSGNFVVVCNVHGYAFLGQFFPILERILLVLSPAGDVLLDKSVQFTTPGTNYGIWLFESGGKIAVISNYYGSMGSVEGGRMDVYSETTGDLLQTISMNEGTKNIEIGDIKQKNDGTLLLVLKDNGPVLTNISFSGDILSKKKLAVPFSANGLFILHDKGLILTAVWDNHAYILKTDSLGNFQPSRVFGRTFIDENKNCKFDTGEPPFPNLILTKNVYPDYFISTDTNGFFEVVTPLGQISFYPKVHPYFQSCVDYFSANFLLGNIDTIDFPIQRKIDCPLLNIDLAAPRFRPCSDGNFQIQYSNLGAATAFSPKIMVELDEKLEFQAASLPPTSVNGQTLIFDLPDVASLENGKITIHFKTSCDAQIGDTLCSTAKISPDSLCLPADDLNFGSFQPFFAKFCRGVVNSFDPNDKSVYPPGRKPGNFISRDSTLHYLIRFQNTGNDTAYSVVVKDALPYLIDRPTIVPGASSHPYIFSMTENGTVTFRFEKINLPAKQTNELTSEGFVQFTVRIKKDASYNSQFYNTAQIFFDNNAPITTNATVLSIDKLNIFTKKDTAFCPGGLFLGIEIFKDTTFSKIDTFYYGTNTLLTHIHVFPSFKNTIDTTLAIGQNVSGYIVKPNFQTIKWNYKTIHGCDSTIFWNIFGITSTGEASQAGFEISPNPFFNEIFIKSIENQLPGNCQFQLINNLGSTVFSENFDPQKLSAGVRWQIPNLPGGVYFLKIWDKKQPHIFGKCLIKQ